MNTPIIDPKTLTEEQREAIKKEYTLNSNLELVAGSILQTYYQVGVYKTLEWIFGEEIFIKKGE